MKHASSYIARTLMTTIVVVEDGRTVDWADILAKSLEKELKHIDLHKGHMRIVPRIYMLLCLDPTQDYPILPLVTSKPPAAGTLKNRSISLVSSLKLTRSMKPKKGVLRLVPS